MKRYTTFEQIDRDLKYLRLKSQIDLEEVKMGLSRSKETLSETFSPMNIVANTLGSIIKRAFVMKVVNKIIGVKRVKKEEYEDD